ncbi:MAG: ABC transporter permease [Chloroflexi bacterium]|jgi:peptide/nickel transport system permease protein|nr:ABC transporter permease [Chloroflexota bacterium]MBT3863284.1 ABC transporter permease [Chloroflexota bacterium]MBT4142327.1 ABC transporter permease [Chloroflexota bacterium]MBT4341976.1 ABC transporter permease [Chloroflexota bacterium]MBT4943679.1 ABC transporter permease [Chloroflexota bacterium]
MTSQPLVAQSTFIRVVAVPMQVFRFTKRWPIIPAVIMFLIVFGAVFAPVIAPFEPQKGDLRARNIPPVWLDGGDSTHWLGTDNLGRDVYSRMLYGARISLFVAAVAVAFGLVMGTLTGVVAGYYGGMVDEVLMRLVDLWSSLPFLLIALIVAISVGPSLGMVIALLAVSSWSAGSRNIRGEVLSLRNREYVQMARVMNASDIRIILRHLLPNVMHVVIVITTLRTGSMIIAEAGLSFLGVGVPASVPTWGLMIAQGQKFLTTTWWMSIAPGVAIFLIVLSFNFLGDWLRDRFDPRLNQLD